jgi:hypothetical protein
VRKYLILLGLLAPGCAGTQDVSSDTSLSTAVSRQILLTQYRRHWKDPDSIKDATIGNAYSCPRHGALGGGATCICIETNARNALGGYTGLKKQVVVIRGVDIDHIKEWDFDDRCQGLEPFPQLNGKR